MTNYIATISAARNRPRSYNQELCVGILDPWAEFLRGTDCNVTSQGGEDGLLCALLDRIGTRNRWCFEVGAHDGVYLSNTKALRDDGWSALLIEADDEKFAELCKTSFLIGPDQKVRCVHCRVEVYRDGDRVLDRLLGRYDDVPRDLDLGVIDIDGEDVNVWRGLTVYRPRVVLIEYNVAGDGELGGYGGVHQAGFDTVCRVGREKGYRPLVKTGCNVLFVDEAEIM